MKRTVASIAAVLGLGLTLVACGGDNSNSATGGGGGSAGGSGGNKGSITLGSANFSESELIMDMYAGALKKAGYNVTTKPQIGAREVYIKALQNNEIDAVPEYVSTLAEYFNVAANGADASTTSPKGSTDAQTALTNLKALVTPLKLQVSDLSPAADQNAFATSKKFATDNNLTTLSDLTKLNGQITLGAGSECPTRPFCEPGLQSTYGLQFKDFKAYDSGGPLTIGALKDGSIQLGLVFSSDGAIAANDLQVLTDDKHLQNADNILALVNSKVSADAVSIMGKVNAALTTSDLQGLNKQISVDKDEPVALATTWLKSHDLG